MHNMMTSCCIVLYRFRHCHCHCCPCHPASVAFTLLRHSIGLSFSHYPLHYSTLPQHPLYDGEEGQTHTVRCSRVYPAEILTTQAGSESQLCKYVCTYVPMELCWCAPDWSFFEWSRCCLCFIVYQFAIIGMAFICCRHLCRCLWTNVHILIKYR